MRIKSLKSKGFTLIELMIVVAIIGILAAVAIPKFADLVTRSREASVKGQMSTTRSAITIYYSQFEGEYPDNLFRELSIGNVFLPPINGTESLGRYQIPAVAGTGGHTTGLWENSTAATAADVATTIAAFVADDGNVLLYANGTSRDGEVLVNCTHNDTKGDSWDSF